MNKQTNVQFRKGILENLKYWYKKNSANIFYVTLYGHV